MSTMTEIFKKRRQIRAAWDQQKLPSSELIKDLLTRTLDLSSSKQNLFPFKIHAYGPHNPKEKKIINQICNLYKTGSVNHWNDEQKDGEFKSAQGNLKSKDTMVDDKGNDYRLAPWVLVFEQRLAEPNNFVKEYSRLHGCPPEERFTQVDPKRYRGVANTKLTCIEVGLFIQTLAGLCLENNLGISYIRSFKEWTWHPVNKSYVKDVNPIGKNWTDLPEISESPLIICQIGYVAPIKDYLQSNSMDPNDIHWENKPHIDTIVQFKD